ncbi:MAG: DNA recombinase [Deltaproteobacteria bacterium CG_4_9_14_3_um_filter_51_14]|nr:MAG: DNA recombinase [Deltaproteobacteria bacterium CG_4_9_14_3_um_filter_51_14]
MVPSGEMLKVEKTVDGHERGRDYLTHQEIDALLKAARGSRYPERDQAVIIMLYRHGFRETELCRIRMTHLNLSTARVWVERIKGSLSTEQPVDGDELRVLRRYMNTRKDGLPWLFLSERQGPLTRHAVIYIVSRSAAAAGLGHVTPHMLRHSCGYYLANKGYDTRLIQDYLGHRDPKHTTRYTRTAAYRFEGLWK